MRWFYFCGDYGGELSLWDRSKEEWHRCGTDEDCYLMTEDEACAIWPNWVDDLIAEESRWPSRVAAAPVI